jgi:hypothetical protein
MTEQNGTGSNLRGRGARSEALIAAMHDICRAAQPITGRGVGYKLFTRALIPSMSTKDMRVVYRLLKIAREDGIIPWEWIVDETRQLERLPAWDDPDQYARCVVRGYRRDYWNQQPARVEVWSEKGTVRGVLQPVLDEYAVGFRVMHGFGSATAVYDVASDFDGERDLIALYVGDWDPSGMYMSEHDLPARLQRYDGYHVQLKRIALTQDQVGSLPAFPASDKARDPRYPWFVRNFGNRCWELDALDPNDLRNCVEAEIAFCLDWEAWQHCKSIENAERESLQEVMRAWNTDQSDG